MQSRQETQRDDITNMHEQDLVPARVMALTYIYIYIHGMPRYIHACLHTYILTKCIYIYIYISIHRMHVMSAACIR